LAPDERAQGGREGGRPAAVAAGGGGAEPGRDGRARSAAGPARRPGQVPWGTGGRPDRGLGVAGQAELGGGGLAGHHRAGRAQGGGDVVAFGRDVVLVNQRT